MKPTFKAIILIYVDKVLKSKLVCHQCKPPCWITIGLNDDPPTECNNVELSE